MIQKLLNQGMTSLRAGDLKTAEHRARMALAKKPGHPGALHLLAMVALRVGDQDTAIKALETAIRVAPRVADLHNHLAEALRGVGRAEEAVAAAREATRLAPNAAAVHNNLGLALRATGDLTAAETALRRACELDPRYPKAPFNLGTVLLTLERPVEAVPAIRRALELNPRYARAWDGLGAALSALDRREEAREAFERATTLAPSMAKPWLHLAQVLEPSRDALAMVDKALALDPGYVDAMVTKGQLLSRLERKDEATAVFRQAVERRRDDPTIWQALGEHFFRHFQFANATRAFERVLELDPDRPEARGSLAFSRAEICAWQDRATEIEALERLIENELEAGKTSPLSPHAAVFFPFPPALHRAIATRHAERIAKRVEPLPPRSPIHTRPDRLRVGYLSSDFRNNALAHLTRRLFGLHDRDRFAIHAYSLGKDDGSEYRSGIAADCDVFVDLRETSDGDAATRIRDDEVDILVDLVGFAGGGRPAIVAHRAAPIQAIWLYPGTMGGLFHDYFIGDRWMSPPDAPSTIDQIAEAVVVLPECYQVNDHRQPIAETTSRAALGVPEDAFVFCCFCAPAKVDPEIFTTWMRILDRVDDSVLWLLDLGEEAQANLRREAEARGIASDRLAFGKHLPKDEHLARLKLADLGLDTRTCNGHTTVSDALWAELPVVTTPGVHLAGHVAGSLLRAIGLPELITPDLAAYESLVVELATSPQRLTAVRAKLVDQRGSFPLFDTPRFVRGLERAYDAMWARHARGEAPATMIIEERES
ncbi:MAG: tetratricopeptide repeat protein [Acidobacteriota bacterium]